MYDRDFLVSASYLDVVILTGVHLPPLIFPCLYKLWCMGLPYLLAESLAADEQ